MVRARTGERMRSRRRGNNEGTEPFQRSDGRWCAAVSVDDGRRRYLYGKTRREVADKLVAALRDVQQGRPLPGQRLTTKRYLVDWLEHTVKPSQKPLTYEKYKQVVDKHLVPAIGTGPLARLGPEHVQRVQGKMAEAGLGVATINGMRTALSAALTQAEQWGLVARNVVRLVAAPRADQTEPRVLRPEEATAFLTAAKGDEMEYLFTTMLGTGLRPGEGRGLRWSDVRLGGSAPAIEVRQQVVELKDQGRVFGDPKSQHGRRSIPLIPLAIAALQAQKRRVAELRLSVGPLWQDRDLVFPGELGEPLVSRTVRDHFERIVRRAGITDAPPHTLRHSTGTFLLAAGVPDRIVQAILGHGSAAMTRHYQHVLPAMLSDAGARLAQFLEGTS